MSIALYELAEQYRELQLLAEDPECDPAALANTLEGLQDQFRDKVIAVACVIENMAADAAAIEKAAASMKRRADRLKGQAERLRAYLLVHMQATAAPPIQHHYFTVAVRKNPPHVEIVDLAKIPDDYKVFPEAPPPSADKTKILAALKADIDVPGAKIGRNNRLEIKS